MASNTIPYQHHLPPSRKPVAASSTASPPHPPAQGHWQPATFPANWSLAPSHQGQLQDYPPPRPQQSPPLPPTFPSSHARSSSIPTMLNRPPNAADVRSPQSGVPALTATHASARQDRGRGRSASPESTAPSANKLQPNRLSPTPRGRSSSAQPPRVRDPSADAPRAVSNPSIAARPASTSSDGPDSPGAKKRRSWFPGGRSRSNSDEINANSRTGTWIITPGGPVEYNTSMLLNGEKVPELWNEGGNVCVFLYPIESGHGPSFKVADTVFGSSRVLYECLLSEAGARGSGLLTADDATRRQPYPKAGENWLQLPLRNNDLETLVAARNLFAFLTNQPLVGTKANPALFSALLNVAVLLRDFAFSRYDGSSFGEEVDQAFELLMEQYAIADVRHSREKTLEALMLAEHMRSWNLYNEAFTHAVGKYDDIVALRSPLFSRLSISTRNRLERARLDLLNREANVNLRLESFEFPSLFAGIASSASLSKTVRFKEWRSSFGKMRSFVLSYYKEQFGNWPPKAKSKKNQFSRGGLNRQCLKMLYWDLCSLYDLLVDRESPTTRAIDDKLPEDNEEEKGANQSILALRKMLTEFDHSSPPVLPPIPFDIPKLPSITAIQPNYNGLPAKQQAKLDKRLQSNELLLMLIKSRNIDTDALQRPFLDAFKDFELKEARGVSPHDLADQRIGHWLFLYVVLQCLPMLVIDAPDLKWTEGVEYFLCQAPQGNPPWSEEGGEVRKMWVRAGGQSLVEVSTDVVLFSVEGIYTRSHCWVAAKLWQDAAAGNAAETGRTGSPHAEPDLERLGPSPLEPPRPVFQDMDPVTNPHAGGSSPRNSSPSGSPHLRPRNQAQHAYRWSMSMGLEPLNMGDVIQGQGGDRTSRIVGTPSSHGHGHGHGHDSRQSSISGLGAFAHHPRQGSGGNLAQLAGSGEEGGSTFDDILKGIEKKEKKKKLFF